MLDNVVELYTVLQISIFGASRYSLSILTPNKISVYILEKKQK